MTGRIHPLLVAHIRVGPADYKTTMTAARHVYGVIIHRLTRDENQKRKDGSDCVQTSSFEVCWKKK